MKDQHDNSETDEISIGEKIRVLRKAQKMTQTELAEGICDACTISRIENGHFPPSKELLDKLLQRLEVKNRGYWFHFDEKNAMEEQLFENAIQMVEQEDMKNNDRWIAALEELKKAQGEKAIHLMELINLIDMEERKALQYPPFTQGAGRLEENILYGYDGDAVLWEMLNEQAKYIVRLRKTEEEIAYHRHVELSCNYMLEQSGNGEGSDCDMDRFFVCVKGVSLIRQEKPEEGEALFFALRSEIEKGRDLYRMNDRRIAVCDINMAIAQILQRRYYDAEDYLRHARRVLESGSISWKLLVRLIHVQVIVSILKKDRKEEALRFMHDAQILCRIRSGGKENAAKKVLYEEMHTGLLISIL